MPKANKTVKSHVLAPAALQEKPLTATLPWRCTSFGNHSEIEASFDAGVSWTTIACVNSVAGHDAEDIANFIVGIVNSYEK